MHVFVCFLLKAVFNQPVVVVFVSADMHHASHEVKMKIKVWNGFPHVSISCSEVKSDKQLLFEYKLKKNQYFFCHIKRNSRFFSKV